MGHIGSSARDLAEMGERAWLNDMRHDVLEGPALIARRPAAVA
jgi:hypothetical protein